MKKMDWLRGFALLTLMVVSISMATATQPVADDLFALELNNLNGGTTAMTDYKSGPLVVNFWATWCPPCIEEMPDLESLNQDYPTVRFVGLAIDTQRNVKKFLEKIPVSYDILVPGYSGVKDMRQLGNPKGGLPYTLVIAADGSIAYQLLGRIDKSDLSTILDNLKN